MLDFDFAQTFFIDPASVSGATTVAITAVDLYFRKKPKDTNNKSGINNPGAEVYLVPTKASIPDLDVLSGARDSDISYELGARMEYTDIVATADSSIPTKFRFSRPMNVKTGEEYAILVKFDGKEDFICWTSKQGDKLFGTNVISPGPSGKYIGNYYSFISSTTDGNLATTSYGASNWRPLSDTDLKFTVYAARYSINGTGVTSGNVPNNQPIYGGGLGSHSGNNVSMVSQNYEYIVYDRKLSRTYSVNGGEFAYQLSFFYPGGANTYSNVSVTSGSNKVTAASALPNGAAFNWSTIFGQGSTPEYIVVHSIDHEDSGRAPFPLYNIRHKTAPRIRTNVRKVVSIESNTVLVVDNVFDFSNSVAGFHKAPVGRVNYRGTTSVTGKNQDLLILEDSNANSSVRFTNGVIEYVTIVAGGSGYSNSDRIVITGYEDVNNAVKGGYNAAMNVVTNSSGGITAVYFSNCGAGFSNADAITVVIANSTSLTSTNTSAGSGADFDFTVGQTIGTEFWGWDAVDTDRQGGYFRGGVVTNLDVGEFIPGIAIDRPTGTGAVLYSQSRYYVEDADTISGKKYLTHPDPTVTRKKINNQEHNGNFGDFQPIILSRSNEYVALYPNGSYSTPATYGSDGFQIIVETTSNNDFITADVKDSVVHFGKFIVNDDYTGENTNYGNAYSKHISKKVNFNNDRFAEDIRVVATAYKPPNTDIQVFARIHNENDDDAFDDKDWTRLELTSGNNVLSSPTNANDYIELTYGFPAYPNTAYQLDGFVTTGSNSATITGVGTTFSTNATANLYPQDLVKIYSPLFPNNYLMAVVNSVANDTSITVKSPISNAGLVGSGFKMDLIGRVGNSTVNALGYPLQAFNAITNDNVVRYYNLSMAEFDTYDTFQIKIVLLADSSRSVPRVDDILAIGVSA